MDFLSEIEAAIPHLRRYARALVGDRDRADDLVQDCLERALSRRSLWRKTGPLKNWLFRILLNRFRDDYRRATARPVLIPIDGSRRVAADGNQDAHLALREVQAAMDRLPDDQRAVLLLVAVEGLSLAEAAAVLGVADGTVASRLARGRAALRQMTEGHPDDRSARNGAGHGQ